MEHTPPLAAPVTDSVFKNEDSILVNGPAGKLEVVSFLPKTPNQFDAVAVVCHPHPLYDGSLNNKVTYTLAKTFSDFGIPSIRFNFRGVGQSEGSYGDGVGETEDLIAVANLARSAFPGKRLWLAGFSFGAYIAFRATECMDADRLVMISPCVNFFNFNKISPATCPWLVVHGQDDEVVPYRDVVEWLENLFPQPDFVSMQQVGHFYHRRLVDLRRVIESHCLGVDESRQIANSV